MLAIRKQLKDQSTLGEYGADAIRRELKALGHSIPSRRTIGRILERNGQLDGRKRVRRPPPPRGWYLPELATRALELDYFDTIEGLAIRGGPHLTILTGISLFGGLAACWPATQISAVTTVTSLIQPWSEWGLPGYAQFDNDNRFTGPRQHRNAIGRVIRLCLSLNVTPVFTAPNEVGFQAAIESFNARWQSKVWTRFQFIGLRDLSRRSERYITATRMRHAARIEAAPPRAKFPADWQLNLQAKPTGKIIFLRRTNGNGALEILGNPFVVDKHWVHRLVRAHVDLDHHCIRFFALRRRAPTDQPLLNEVPYQLPNRHFKE
ncbi:MAG TPA: hypothetical protein VHI52_00610 [Verrucomicrobiae bacterium]|nr:hypothetical protein [Verrucomicrobiae bacterium]